ncbi:MAG: hypothetical protein ACUVUH_08415, partial [bacterium]
LYGLGLRLVTAFINTNWCSHRNNFRSEYINSASFECHFLRVLIHLFLSAFLPFHFLTFLFIPTFIGTHLTSLLYVRVSKNPQFLVGP